MEKQKSFRIGLALILILFFSLVSFAANSNPPKEIAFVRFVCFHKNAIDRLIADDKIDRNKAMLTFRVLVQLRACAVMPQGKLLKINRTLKEYKDSKGDPTFLIEIIDQAQNVFYTIIEKQNIKEQGLKV